jgi:hypothetical protein
MKCKTCEGERIAHVSGKTSDMCCFRYRESEVLGPVPPDLGIGGADYLEFNFCLDCGTIQDRDFPIDPEVLQAILDGEY